ncbi:hypothetical protein EUTSA_v10023935mg [Eutrema salsugineum]|uniref:Neprosin PEP catalytic domain-containing protein n=2 Tax=Eutrema salsugineum TaxID=72664 RepID=V4KIB4_EUTSA|nr:hypothetical protein EUTSA_v10023935mg [Eutrema salsugineum]
MHFVLIILTVIVTEDFRTQDDEIDQFLKKLNKPALKSIKSPDGDIIDCAHMKNHPIYDHPLFKNHTIQMRPSSYPKGWNNESSDLEKQSTITQLWTINGKCPKNSIPIRRTKKEDILRAGSIKQYMKKYPNVVRQPKPENSTSNNYTHEYATVILKGRFHGTKAFINVWKPHVQTPREFSLAQLWLLGGPNDDELNTIEAGWHVYPKRYGDDNPRYFIYWTADGYRDSGCYNLDCKGFVHTNQEFALGASCSQVSSLDGQQHEFPITIWKDPGSGNWWLRSGTHLIIGYWPSSLFNHLQVGANEVHWGGEIINFNDDSQHTTTKMGSGQFAQEGLKKASYFRNLEIINEDDISAPPLGESYIQITQENCYNVKSDYESSWGYFFYYGGPGRNPNCI